MDEQNSSDIIQTFDNLFTNNNIQMYKVLLPYFEPSTQKTMAIYIKFMEFQYTMAYFKHHPYAFLPQNKDLDAGDICKKILPYCAPKEKKQIEQLIEMFANLKNMQEMMDTINMMQEMFPESFSGSFPEGFPFGDGDGGIPPDMMQMFQMFGK